jgi:hypothetical protein
MSTARLALALNELAAALLELAEDGNPVAGPPPSATGPAVAFASATPPSPVPAGNCPVHNIPWRTTKSDGSPAKRAYCSQKNEDGSYCDAKGPWLTLK